MILSYANDVFSKLVLSGFTEINLTKLDVLSGFPEVKIGQKYTLNGKEVEGMPASLAEYSSIVVEYEVMPGWTEDVSAVKKFEDLPVNCQAYVLRLEELIGVPIRYLIPFILLFPFFYTFLEQSLLNYSHYFRLHRCYQYLLNRWIGVGPGRLDLIEKK